MTADRLASMRRLGAELEEIIASYSRMNRWADAIEARSGFLNDAERATFEGEVASLAERLRLADAQSAALAWGAGEGRA